MATIAKFVDSIAASPTPRFDCNNGTTTKVLMHGTTLGSPTLNQVYTPSLLVDGGLVGSSAHGLRQIILSIQVTAPTMTAGNTLIGALFRELDRPTNLLMWRDEGDTDPVFFETFRTQPGDVNIENAGVGIWDVTARITAKPYAKGLRVDLAQQVMTNAASNAPAGVDCFVAITGIIGDVPAPIVAWATREPDSLASWYLSRSDRAPMLFEVDGWTNGPNTTSVTSDASLSNSAGKTSTFAAADNGASMTGVGLTASGSYRVVMQARSASGSITVDLEVWVVGAVATLRAIADAVSLSSSNTIVDLGIISFAPKTEGSTELETQIDELLYLANRSAGSANLVVDWIGLLPADDGTETAILQNGHPAGTVPTMVIDGILDTEYVVTSTSPFGAGAGISPPSPAINRSGSYPELKPGITNYLTLLRFGVSGISSSTGLFISYWPLFLYQRPAS